MPIAAADLLQPKGRVSYSWYGDPADVVRGWLEQWLEDGYADVQVAALSTDAQKDTATRAYATWKALEKKADDVNAEAATISLADQGGRTRTSAQMTYWSTLAEQARQAFQDALTPDVPGDGAPVRPVVYSQSAPIIYGW